MRRLPQGERDAAGSCEQQHRSDAAEIVTFRLNIKIPPARSWLFERWKKKA